ncbi:cysteine desulfurase family protein [Deinococcus radiomollis]|uniref:cysteine desulfurase family protein n=1 Tax=Deinococcus radiomollis TaxID=468916 RepID=UPI003891DEAB
MIYLDYAATQPMRPSALEAYLSVAAHAGNPASVHRAGQQMRERLEEGRALVAAALGASPLELLVNGGGTEGDNQVLLGLAAARGHAGHIVTSQLEHSALLAPARWLETQGVQVSFLPPGPGGIVTPQALRDAMRPDTFLVSIHHANNEVGVVQDVAALAQVAHAGGALFHTDAVQSPGVLPVDLHGWGVDFASFSAHKWGGPLGVGFLYLRRGLELPPMLLGGGQEKGLRAGTQNAPGVYAAGVALREAVAEQPEAHAHLRMLNDRMTALLALPNTGVSANHTPEGSPKVASFTAHGADGEALLMNLDMSGVAASAGSACSAGTMQPSHVLTALGLSDHDARASIRFSFGAATTTTEVEQAAATFLQAAENSRP